MVTKVQVFLSFKAIRVSAIHRFNIWLSVPFEKEHSNGETWGLPIAHIQYSRLELEFRKACGPPLFAQARWPAWPKSCARPSRLLHAMPHQRTSKQAQQALPRCSAAVLFCWCAILLVRLLARLLCPLHPAPSPASPVPLCVPLRALPSPSRVPAPAAATVPCCAAPLLCCCVVHC